MRFLSNYELFNEVRLSDIANIQGLTHSTDVSFKNFLKYKTISNRINNKKIRLNIDWYNTDTHDLTDRLISRTSLKNIGELNQLLNSGLDELYSECVNYIEEDGEYSLWFSEYNFSIIINKSKNNIYIKTILSGLNTNNVKNTIELKSTL